jgi:hypothetical protein
MLSEIKKDNSFLSYPRFDEKHVFYFVCVFSVFSVFSVCV